VIGSGGGWWWPRLAETTAGVGMLMLQTAGLVHVTASVRIVCVKMSNKCKQTALDLDQKIEGGKNRQQLRRLTVRRNKQLTRYVCYCFAASWCNNDDDDDWHCISSVRS